MTTEIELDETASSIAKELLDLGLVHEVNRIYIYLILFKLIILFVL